MSQSALSHSRPRRRTRSIRAIVAESLEARHLLAQVAGTLIEDTVWRRDESPIEVTGTLRVPKNVTLTIEPGVVIRFDDSTGLHVQGQLLAEGSPAERIQFTGFAGHGLWDGFWFDQTLADNRVRYADIHGGDQQGHSINVDHSRLNLDHVVWSDTIRTILELNHPSIVVRNSDFPKTIENQEVVHGQHIVGDEYLILDGNVFANSRHGGDVIDFLGAEHPGPIVQILNNVFQGGGDDGLDLDGTDAHVEGNVFMNFRNNSARRTTSNAIATGAPQNGDANRTELSIVRNIFIDNDHALLLKEDAFALIENNVFVNSTFAAIQFSEVDGSNPLGPGKGATSTGNIFSGNARLFAHLVDTPDFTTMLSVDHSLLPNDTITVGDAQVQVHDLGTGNVSGDPLFVDPAAGDFGLQQGSPAIGQGPKGRDIGAYVPESATITARGPVDSDGHVTLDVDGPGVTHYRYRLDGQTLSPLTPVGQPIELNGLAIGAHDVEVVAMNRAGEWLTGPTSSWQRRSYDLLAPAHVRPGETIPVVTRALDWQSGIDTSFTDWRALNTHDGQSSHTLLIQKGVAATTLPVTGNSSFALTLEDASTTPGLLPPDFPTEEIEGNLVGDIAWTPDREYHVTSDLTIPAGSRLTIMPGTRILLSPATNIFVHGTIRSRGTQDAPVLFTSRNDGAWGGLEFIDAAPSEFRFTFLTNGGGDSSRNFGHSNSQPVVMAIRSDVECDHCFMVDNVGKAFGARSGRIDIRDSIIANVDTGGEFSSSVARITNTWIMNIPNDQPTFIDDDNDGFYFSGVHNSGEASRFEDSYIMNTKDDGLDHNGARLEVVRGWVEGAIHEGLAGSNREWASITDSVFLRNNQGVEAGYGEPHVSVSHSVMADNVSTIDPSTPITSGLRFGDGYDGRLGDYTGHITAQYNVIHNNGDNVRNFDGSIPGPQPGAMDVTYSLANDTDAVGSTNLSGVPVFGPSMHLLRASAGFDAGPEGMPLGRLVPQTTLTLVVGENADFNNDGVINGTDIDRLCSEIHSTMPTMLFDLTGDAAVDLADHAQLITGVLQTTYGDADLDTVFNSTDLVKVLVRGEYEDTLPNNSSWADGDWNCDGEFDSQDIVIALAAGGYVAEATDLAIANWGHEIDIADLAAAFNDDDNATHRHRTAFVA